MIDHNYKLIEGWFDMEEQYLYLLDKVPEGGSIMVGHDYGWSGVSKAVNEKFTPYKIKNNCWFVKISK